MTQPKIDHYERTADDRIQLVTIAGRDYLAFTVRAGDVLWWDKQAGNRGPNQELSERAEVSPALEGPGKGKGPGLVREGMVQTYDVDYYFLDGFPPHVSGKHEWAVITQFHQQDENPSGVKGFGGVTVHDGQITLDRGDGTYFVTEPIATNTRMSRRLVVKWDAKNGYAKWIDRETGKLIGQFTGQTIAAGEYKYLKWGYYRAGGLPPGTVCIGGANGAIIEVTDGDLSAQTPAPTPEAPPSPLPAPPANAAPPGAPQWLVDVRLTLEAELAHANADISVATDRRDAIQKALKPMAAALDSGKGWLGT